MNKLKYIVPVLIVIAGLGLQQALAGNAVTNMLAVTTAPMPPAPLTVPDGGATVMLLGAGLGALGMVRRFLKT